jgi:hypothetical protein
MMIRVLNRIHAHEVISVLYNKQQPLCMEMEMTKSDQLGKSNAIDGPTSSTVDPARGAVVSGRIQDAFSSELGVRPSTFRKILAGKTVSPILERKIDAALRNGVMKHLARIGRSSPERLMQTFLL